MSFKDESWEKRFAKLGDEAEGVFEHVILYKMRTGLDRPDIPLEYMPSTVRYAPDYWGTLAGSICSGYYEVQGCGKDQIIKLKLQKHRSILEWDKCIDVVYYFFWNAKVREWAIIPASAIDPENYEKDKFPDNGLEYMKIGWSRVIFLAARSGYL